MTAGNSVPKAAIYIRVSTEEQWREGYSLPAQESRLREYCERKGYEVFDLYADRGISAKDIQHRPEMLRLLQDAEKERVNAVCVFALSRFSRNVADLYKTCSILKAHKISLESCTEPFDTSTPIGMAIVGILGVVAQLEREQTSERVAAAMLERAKQGKRTCSYVLGYDREGTYGLAVNPKEAAIVKFIFQAYSKHQNLSIVSRMCADLGYRGKNGAVMQPYNIRVILTRPIYAGYNSFHGQLYRGKHHPIVSVPMFNHVQLRLLQSGKKCKTRPPVPIIESSMSA